MQEFIKIENFSTSPNNLPIGHVWIVCFQNKLFVKQNKARFVWYKNFTWRTSYIFSSLFQYIPHPFLFPVSEWIPNFLKSFTFIKLVTFRNSFISLFQCWIVRNSRPWGRERAKSYSLVKSNGFDNRFLSLGYLFSFFVKNKPFFSPDFRRVMEVQNDIFNEKSHFLACILYIAKYMQYLVNIIVDHQSTIFVD